MALKMPKLFGERRRSSPRPKPISTCRRRRSGWAASTPEGYDPLATVSVMEQLRAATAKAITPWTLPFIGDLPVAKQLQVLGTLFVTFLVLAALMVAPRQPRRVAGRAGDRHRDRDADALAAPRARLRARGAGPGRARSPRCSDSRERFDANLDALLNGGEVRGKSLDVAQDPRHGRAARPDPRPLDEGRHGRRAAGRQRAEPDHARQGPRRHQPGQQRHPRARAAGGAADRPGRRQPARHRVREPARRALAADRQERQRARPSASRSTRRSRSCWARTPGRSATC